MARHVWLTKEFSVSEDTLCMHEKTKVPQGADWQTAKREKTGHVCLLGRNHRGKHVWTYDPDIRDYGFRDRQA